MFDAAAARRLMVDGQIRTADVTNPSLIEAMQEVPRELFVPPAMAAQAYRDGDLSLGDGRAMLRPIVIGKLIQGADVRLGDHVLDVGSGTGAYGCRGRGARRGRGFGAAGRSSACLDRSWAGHNREGTADSRLAGGGAL